MDTAKALYTKSVDESLQPLLERRESALKEKDTKKKSLLLASANLQICSYYYSNDQTYKLTPYLEETLRVLTELVPTLKETNKLKITEGLLYELVGYYQKRNYQEKVANCYNWLVTVSALQEDYKNCAKYKAYESIAWSYVPKMKTNALSPEEITKQYGEEYKEEIDKIFSHRKKLKSDPVEQTEKYQSIYDQAEEMIQKKIEKEGRLKRGGGFQYYRIKKEVLKNEFKIDWTSPVGLNPRVVFD